MITRKTYTVAVELTVHSCESAETVVRLVSEALGVMYHEMERENLIRVVLQHRLEVVER